MISTAHMSTSAQTSKLDNRRYSVDLEGVDTSVANALRRIALSDIPYIATHRCVQRSNLTKGGFVVRTNTGRLHNDMLCDRIALVPIFLTVAEVDSFIPGSITVLLDVENVGSGSVDVTSRDLRTRLFGKPHPNDRTCFPACDMTGDGVLITRLFPGEKIDLTATLEKSTASTHAAFAVASTVALQPSLDEELYRSTRREIERDQSLGDRERATSLNKHDHITRQRLIKVAKDRSGEPASHRLTIESECGFNGRDIFLRSLDILHDNFASSAFAYESTIVGNSIRYEIRGKGHTFGSVFQDICSKNKDQLDIASIGYYLSHPLDDKVVVHVTPRNAPVSKINHREMMSLLKVRCVRAIDELKEKHRAKLKHVDVT